MVDDNLTNRQAIEESLTLIGYEPDFASDAAAGWDAIQAKRYD